MESQKTIKNYWIYQFLGWLFLALIFAAVVSVVYYQQMKSLPVGTAVVHTDPTASWNTYTNEELGFAFRYPASQEISIGDSNRPLFEGGKSFVLAEPGAKWAYSVDVKKNTKQVTLETSFNQLLDFWQKTITKDTDYQLKDLHVSDDVLAGVVAKKLFIENFGDIGANQVMAMSRGNIYLITGGNASKDLDTFLNEFVFLKTN